MPDHDPHPGKNIHKIPLKGWVGLAFVIGFMVLCLIASSAVRWFFLLSIPPGILIGVILYLAHRRRV